MKYQQYKRVIEREHRMGLKKVMHHICVEEGLNAIEGEKKLGIAKEVFVYWQHHYRFSKRQLLFDEIINNLKLPGDLK
ncbi:hypothetical protein [Planococcus alpniumensis]|uniref:hypothetical protein n=1 Tax=Planococcus alpniumensis TaxID=2708345 RepID=UPI001B8B1BE5|nr:hypothetical protein [Planococcus sp. MSAK28401]